MQKIHLSTTGQYLAGYANILIHSERIDDFIDMSIEPDSVGLLFINGLFSNFSLSDSCFMLFTIRKWLSRNGALNMEGYGSLGVNFPTLILRVFYACGFLIGNPPPLLCQSDTKNSIYAVKNCCEMPEYLLIQRIYKLLYLFDQNSGSHAVQFMKLINRRSAHDGMQRVC